VRAVLNFSPVRLQARPRVMLKNVDLRSQLEGMAFFLRG
jgi:NADH/NAD ratio-sensing transcriptional regulator Rex